MQSALSVPVLQGQKALAYIHIRANALNALHDTNVLINVFVQLFFNFLHYSCFAQV